MLMPRSRLNAPLFDARLTALGWAGTLLAMLALFANDGSAASQAPASTASTPDGISIAEVCQNLGLSAVTTPDRHTVTLAREGRKGTVTANSRNLIIDGVKVILGDAVEERRGQLFISRIDYEKRWLPLWRPELMPARPKIPHVIVLDPGHGGWATGAENKELKVQEKTLTLDVALRLKPLLEAKGWTVVLTRDHDMALAEKIEADLDARSAIAAKCGADIFVSIHFDADVARALRGSEIFTYAPLHQWATADWEAAQTRGARSPTLDAGAVEVPANHQDVWNTLLAHALYTHMVPALDTADLGERIAHFRVLSQLTCPGVLVESAYVSNPMEALRAFSPEFRQHVAEVLAAGLDDYAERIRKLNDVAKDEKSSGK